MKVRSFLILGLVFPAVAGGAGDADAFRARLHQVGLYTDSPVDSTCFSGPAGSRFYQRAWVFTPDAVGLRYVTLRLVFPDNLRPVHKPEFADEVVKFISTDFVDGTVEWNMLLAGCSPGWVKVFQQEVELLDSLPSKVALHGGDSWIRDCDFEIYRIDVTNEILLNSPGCGTVPALPLGWSVFKSRYDGRIPD